MAVKRQIVIKGVKNIHIAYQESETSVPGTKDAFKKSWSAE